MGMNTFYKRNKGINNSKAKGFISLQHYCKLRLTAASCICLHPIKCLISLMDRWPCSLSSALLRQTNDIRHIHISEQPATQTGSTSNSSVLTFFKTPWYTWNHSLCRTRSFNPSVFNFWWRKKRKKTNSSHHHSHTDFISKTFYRKTSSY